MTLREKQTLFTKLVAILIQNIYLAGYECTFGEAYRSPWEAERLMNEGKGIKGSLHTSRLAIDLNLFKDGKYLTRTEDYERFGKFWESLSGANYTCAWGGRFQDGNHFSIAHNGRK